jgi:hypothetical protein
MSALFDSMAVDTDGNPLDASYGVSSASGTDYEMQNPSPSSAGSSYGVGTLQTLMTLGTGYLSKRLDVDLAHRASGAQVMPGLRTTQNGIGGYGQFVKAPGGQAVAQLNLSALLPLFLVAGAAWFLATKRG